MPLDLEKIDIGSFGISDDFAQTEQDTQLNASVTEAVKVDPDQHVKMTQLSQQSGVPEFAVQDNPEAVENDLKLDNIDLSNMSQRSPNTAAYLTDFNNAAIAHDDIDIMQSIEDVFDVSKTFENIGESIKTNFNAQGTGLIASGVDLTPSRINDLIPASAMPIGMESDAVMLSQEFAANFGIDTDEQLQQAKSEGVDQITTRLREIHKKRKDLTPEDLNLLEQGVRAGIESLANMGLGITAMVVSGGRAAPMLATIGVQSFGDAYGEARSEGLTPEQSGWFASINAAIEVGTELLPTGTLETIITGKSKGLSKAALKFAVQEMGTEQLATLGQSINSFAFGLDEQMENAETVEEMVQIQLQRQAVTAIATIVAGGTQIAAATGVRKSIEAITKDGNAKISQGDTEQRQIDRLNENVEQSKLRERSKESFKQFVEQADGENNTTVFIDAAQTSLYLQTKTREEISEDAGLTLLRDQVNEASALGGQVSMPVADFATDLAGTDHFTQLRDSMTMSDETISPFRQEQVEQETQTYIRTLLDEADDNVSQFVEAQEIYDTVKQQLVDSGQVNAQNAATMAQVVPAWATAQARRSGKTVQQVYQESGLIIEGPLTGERERLEGEADLLTQEIDLEQLLKEFDELGFPTEITETQQQSIFDEPVDQRREKLLEITGLDENASWTSERLSRVIAENQTAEGTDSRVAFVNPAEFVNATTADQGVSAEQIAEEAGELDVERLRGELDTPFIWVGDQGEIVGHEGRHRLAALAVSGVGRVPIRVRFMAGTDFADTPSERRSFTFKAQEFEQGRGTDLTTNEAYLLLSENEQVIADAMSDDPSVLFQTDAAESADLLAQAPVEDRNLVVTHNLSSENILAAADLGGLAAPSIATIRTDISDFDQFGEVSLLADPSLLESAKARTFDADVYTPRQPRATFEINLKKFNELNDQLDPDGLGLSKPDINSLEDGTGADNLQRSTAVQQLWLQEQGKAPKPKARKAAPAIKKAAKIEGTVDHLNPEVQKLATQHYKALLKKVAAADEGRTERYQGLWFEEDGTISPRSIIDFVNEVRSFKRSGGIDTHELRKDIDKKLRVKKNRDEYDQWVTDKFNDMVTGQKLFKGFTPAGNRKYVDYNMQNVVKEMTQQLQSGEASFYGAGTVRSAFANEMKTIAQVQARRDQIVSEAEMTQVKEDSADILEQALDDLKPFYKFDADSWGYAEDAGNAIMEGRKGLNETFNMTPEAQQVADDLVNYLTALPSSYFETKIQRPVDFSEFNTAVVPRGMNKNALQVLKDAGLKIKTYDPDGKGKTRQQVISEQEKLLFQPVSEDAPGARGYYDPSNSIIRLTESADLSTFLHEFAHFMYEMEVNASTEMLDSINNWYKRNGEDVAKEANKYLTKKGFDAEKQLGDEPADVTVAVEDVTAYLDDGTTGDKNKDSAVRRAVHEQFARGFETYLMEGKAPSIELRNAFRTFARWLSQIYQTLRGDLNVNLDLEMRQVFDRLLATEEQIAAAEARQRIEPMFTDAAMAGMTEEEFSDYEIRQSKVKDVQSETLRDKMIKQLTRQQQKWWNEQKQDIIDEELESLSSQRVHAARTQLKDGGIKLDFATVKEISGEQRTDKLGRTTVRVSEKLRGMTAKNNQGLHPDEAAAMLGYNSGSEMIDDLISAPSLKDAADSAAETRMVEIHGDIMTDGTIQREADEAVQSEERGKLLLHELKIVARGANAPIVERQTMKAIAAERIGKLSFRQIHPGKYRSAEIRAAQDATRMLVAGNKQGAAEAKMRQVMNYYLGMEANNAKNDTVKIVDRMARYNKKKVQTEIMKSNGGHWEQIVKILERFEFRKAATLVQVDRVNQDINTWMKERMEVEGDGLVLSNAVLNESFITHWKNVPFSDLEGINDSVKNIEHVARYSNKINMLAEEIEFKKLKADWVNSIEEQDQRFERKDSKSRTADSRDATLSEHVRRWASQLTKVPFLASWLDGGERVGLSHQILIQPLTDALDAKLNMVDAVASPVNEAILNRSKADQKRHMRKIWIPEIEDHLMGHQVLAVALNTGNEGNLRKLLLGEGWADPDVDASISIDNPQLQGVLKHMTKSDWELVQLVWDQMETLYPQLSEVHRRTTGLTPPKVEAVPIENEHGSFRGGYYPVKYSPERSHKAEKNAEKLEAETESMFNNTASIQASVNTGSTNERTGFYDRINLSLDVVPDHFNETIHYITHHDAVRQINKLIQAPDVANAITGVLGESEYKQLKPWLNDVAKDGRQQPTKTYIDEAFQRLRFGVTLGVMGFKASTGIMQFFGLLTTAAELGVGPTVKGIYTTIGRSWYTKAVRRSLGSVDDMHSSWDFVSERSKVMPHRAETMDREIRSAMTRLKGKRGIIAATQEVSMKHIALIQTYMVDLPTWMAAYDKTISETGDETKAIQTADFMVESLQGSGSTKDMAAIVRNQSKVITTFTMFMTFFSSLGNLTRDLAKGSRTGLYSPTSVAAKSMFLFTIPVFMEMLMRGELDEPEDEDDRLSKYATGVALYPLASIPFVRDVASGLIGDFGYNSSPVAAMLERGISGFKGITTAAVTDKEVTEGQVKSATKLAGAALGVPGVSQMWATGEHLYDVIEEGEDFTVREALFGPERK